MPRWVVAVLVAGLALQTTGLLAVIAPDDCVVASSPDTSSDNCPECASCLCCPHLLPTAETSTVVLVPVGRGTAPLAAAATRLRDPAPRDILHVPRFA